MEPILVLLCFLFLVSSLTNQSDNNANLEVFETSEKDGGKVTDAIHYLARVS